MPENNTQIHNARIEREVKDCLYETGLDEPDIELFMAMLIDGEIMHVSINYEDTPDA